MTGLFQIRKVVSKRQTQCLTQTKGIRGTYPRAVPVDQAIGWYEYARAKFVWSVISAIMLLITPMLPLSAPFKARLKIC